MVVRASVLPRGGTPDVQRVIEASQSDRRQENIQAASAGPFGKGKSVSTTLVAAGNKTVVHNLGRVPAGYILTSCEVAPPSFYLVSKTKTDMVLFSDNASEVELWVY